MLKHLGLFTLIVFVITFIFTIFSSLTLVNFINVLFIVSLLTFMIGGFLFTIENGFFKVFSFSYRRYLRSLNKNKYIEDETYTREDDFKEPPNFVITKPMFYGSIILILITIIVGFQL